MLPHAASRRPAPPRPAHVPSDNYAITGARAATAARTARDRHSLLVVTLNLLILSSSLDIGWNINNFGSLP